MRALRFDALDGFTLIELAVVLLLIALVTGGIILGRDLIHVAQLRQITADIERYDAAIMAFKGKYGCLPGDCQTASDFGLADAGCPAANTCDVSLPYAAAGCNGNGDQRLNDGLNYDPNLTARYMVCLENLSFWHHLSTTQLIQGTFDGVSVDSVPAQYNTMTPVYGRSAPQSGLRDIGIATKEYRFVIGAAAAWPNHRLTPWEALYFDNKLDDGKAHSGRVRAEYSFSSSPLCAVPIIGTYLVTDAKPKCSILIPMQGFIDGPDS